MNRHEYLDRLEKKLSSLPYGEQQAALRFYEEYFDDAGVEHEAEIIKELGLPEQLAKRIIAEAATFAEQAEEPKSAPKGATYAAFHSIKADLANANVTIERADKDLVDIDYPSDIKPPECELRDGILYLREEFRRFRWFGFNESCRSGNVRIYLSRERYASFEIKQINGSTKVEGITLDRLKLDNVNGLVSVSNVNADSINIDNVNGKLTVDGIVSPKCDLETVNGSLVLSGSVSGLVKCSNVNGSIRITTSLPESAYNYRMSTISGSCRINGVKYGKDYRRDCGAYNTITASTVNGGININTDGGDI